MNIFLFILILGVIFLGYKKISSKKPKNLKLDKFKNKLQSTQTNIDRIFLREEEKTFSNPNINIHIGVYDNEENINRKSKVDSYGCGDSFAAGILYGMTAKWDIDKSLNLAKVMGRDASEFFGPYENSDEK